MATQISHNDRIPYLTNVVMRVKRLAWVQMSLGVLSLDVLHFILELGSLCGDSAMDLYCRDASVTTHQAEKLGYEPLLGRHAQRSWSRQAGYEQNVGVQGFPRQSEVYRQRRHDVSHCLMLSPPCQHTAQSGESGLLQSAD